VNEFYDHLAASFDVMTDWSSRLAYEIPFLDATLTRQRARAVLDAACGTGWHAIALAQRGYRVAGSDASAAMIERARGNAAEAGLTIEFAVASFQDLGSTWREPFDAVLCLGNSFPHVLTEQAAIDSLAGMRASVRDSGLLILHNLNYDKRMRDRPRWFAVNSEMLDGNETLVWRFADYGPDLITFNIAVFAKKSDGQWSVHVESTPQRPYRKGELEDLLYRVGFRTVEAYGNLQGDPFDPARSGDLVIVASP
jgi:glycine/sarcosine N-methyltransferase